MDDIRKDLSLALRVCGDERVGIDSLRSPIERVRAVFDSIRHDWWIGEASDGLRYVGTYYAARSDFVMLDFSGQERLTTLLKQKDVISWSASPDGSLLTVCTTGLIRTLSLRGGEVTIADECTVTGSASFCWGELGSRLWSCKQCLIIRSGQSLSARSPLSQTWRVERDRELAEAARPLFVKGVEIDGKWVPPSAEAVRVHLFKEDVVLPTTLASDVPGVWTRARRKWLQWNWGVWSYFAPHPKGGLVQSVGGERRVLNPGFNFARCGSFQVGRDRRVWAELDGEQGCFVWKLGAEGKVK